MTNKPIKGWDKMKISEARESDIPEVAILHNELVYYIQRETQDPYWDFQVLPIEDISKHLQGFIDSNDRKIYIAQDEKRIVGFIACEIIQCHLPVSSMKKVGYISGAFVIPEYRGKGIIKILEKKSLEFFKKLDMKYVELNFISNNEIARNCWEALGYKTFREQARKEI